MPAALVTRHACSRCTMRAIDRIRPIPGHNACAAFLSSRQTAPLPGGVSTPGEREDVKPPGARQDRGDGST